MTSQPSYNPRAGMSDVVKPTLGRRKHGRVVLETVGSSIGQVLDLSVGGMRAITRRVPRRDRTFSLHVFDAVAAIEVTAQVVWSRRIGILRHEVGIEFVDVSDEAAQALTRLAMVNRHPRAA